MTRRAVLALHAAGDGRARRGSRDGGRSWVVEGTPQLLTDFHLCLVLPADPVRGLSPARCRGVPRLLQERAPCNDVLLNLTGMFASIVCALIDSQFG